MDPTTRSPPSNPRLISLLGPRQRNGTHLIRMIFDATSRADNKTKSRWTRALRYAWHERREWKRLETFFQEHGGPAGCAARLAALNRGKHDTSRVIYRCPGTRRPFLIIENGKMPRNPAKVDKRTRSK